MIKNNNMYLSSIVDPAMLQLDQLTQFIRVIWVYISDQNY